jgi:hypothetical protein
MTPRLCALLNSIANGHTGHSGMTTTSTTAGDTSMVDLDSEAAGVEDATIPTAASAADDPTLGEVVIGMTPVSTSTCRRVQI